MTNKRLLLTLLSLFLIFQLSAAYIYVVNSESRTLSRVDTKTNEVNNNFAQIGLTGNLMDLDDDYIWVVCSGDNAVLEIDRHTGAQIRYMNVEASSNPYDVLKVDDHLYVTGLFTNKVYKISLASGSVVASLEVGDAPQGLATDGNYLFVANTGGWQNDYANSSVSVITLSDFSVANTIDTWTNPQFVVVRNGKLHVSCTGNWFDIAGKVQIIDIPSWQIEATVELGGQPGCLWIASDERALVGEAMGAGFYMYMADTYQIVNGSGNLLQPGGYVVSGTNSEICLLEFVARDNCLLHLLNYDLSLKTQYSVGLASTDIKFYTKPTSNDDLVLQPKMNVYPNPVMKHGILNFESEAKAPLKVSIYDIKGRKVLETESLSGSISLDLTGKALSSGMYLYKVHQRDRIKSGKFIVM
ncbi:MAG TPA: hypothetical protein DCQ12_00880 [Candidatus Cloacimonas sp.]|mgnify:CR=1 FL=1|jgi:hypothetical protein|nr:hypothetical protein [Candidatus Cloacimonas sp.]